MTIPQGEKAERKENRRRGGGRQADTVVGDSSKTIKGNFSTSRNEKLKHSISQKLLFNVAQGA